MFDAWACPNDCEHLAAELDHRIRDMTVSGNYYKLVRMGGKGPMIWQEYRGDIAFGRPKTSDGQPGPRLPWLRRIREMYRARRH